MDTAAAAGRHRDAGCCFSSRWRFPKHHSFHSLSPQQPGAAPPLCFVRPPPTRAAAKRAREDDDADNRGGSEDLPSGAAAGSLRKRVRARASPDQVITTGPSFVPGTTEEEGKPRSELQRSNRETPIVPDEEEDLDLEVEGVIDVRGTALDTVGANSDDVIADAYSGEWLRESQPRTRLDDDTLGGGPVVARSNHLSAALVPRRLYSRRFAQGAGVPDFPRLPHLRISDEFHFQSLADHHQTAAADPHERRDPESEKQLVLYRPAPSLLLPTTSRRNPPLPPQEIDKVVDAVDAMDLS